MLPPLYTRTQSLDFGGNNPDILLEIREHIFRHAMSLAPTPVRPSVRPLVILLKLLESKGTRSPMMTCCSELPESKDGNASGVHEGLNARAMYMKA